VCGVGWGGGIYACMQHMCSPNDVDIDAVLYCSGSSDGEHDGGLRQQQRIVSDTNCKYACACTSSQVGASGLWIPTSFGSMQVIK
jgi:hypothetical protein